MSQINLAALAAEKATEDEAVTVPINDNNGEQYTNAAGAPVTMSVLGQHSAAVRAATLANSRRFQKLRQRAEDVPLEFWEENARRECAAALVAWGVEDENGAPVPVTPDNVKAVCKVAPWIQKQITDAMNGHARFFSPGSENS
jgi:hypothetical protein